MSSSKITTQDLMMQQTLGELKEANKTIAQNLIHIKDNLKILNDNNILHAENEKLAHAGIEKTLNKYWWLIIVLFVVVLSVMGYKEFLNFIPVL